MKPISYRYHRLPSAIIQHAVWLYYRFTLIDRDVEDFLTERVIDVSYETMRRWPLNFGTIYARCLRCPRPQPHVQWHRVEVIISIGGRQVYLWRAADNMTTPLRVILAQ